MQVDEHMQSKALTPPDDLVGQMNHQKAMDLAARQLDEGSPLDVQGVVRADVANGKFTEVPDVALIAGRVADVPDSVAFTGENVAVPANSVDTVVAPVDEKPNLQGNQVDEISNLQHRAEIEDAHLDQPIVIAKAEDGTPITTTGREMLEDVRNQQIQADNDSKSFLAAIECFISSGDMV